MPDRPDHLEWLASIEGELGPQEEARLRARLASEPGALRTLDLLRQDRQSLRTLEEPELPADFLVRLESMMARPMLMEPLASPTQAMLGDSDRLKRQRQRFRRVRWGRAAALAAAVGLAAGAVVFAALGPNWWTKPVLVANNDLHEADRPDERLASSDSGASAARGAVQETLAFHGIVHHYGPSQVGMGVPEERVATDPTVGKTPQVARTLVAEFAIVMAAGDLTVAEQAAGRAAASLEGRGALVRNFSYQEAQDLSERWLAARAVGGSDAPPQGMPALAHGPGASPAAAVAELAERVRDQLAASPRPATASSGRLVGPETLVPSLEQQLDFSSRGAAYTLAVPASDLPKVIRQLTLEENQEAALRAMPSATMFEDGDASSKPTWSPLDDWLAQGGRLRQAVGSLARSREDIVLLVPVIVIERGSD